jgi:RimJ/RimL family protein N-acetyltransferase
VIEEIPVAQLSAYAASFTGAQSALAWASIAEGNTNGQLWLVTQPSHDPAFLLWDKGNNVLYLAGQHPTKAAQAALTDLIAARIRQQALAENKVYFKACPLSPAFADALPEVFHGISLQESPTFFYRFDQPDIAAFEDPAVEGITLVQIDRSLLARTNLENIPQVAAEIRWMWASEERFYEQGFGYAAVTKQRAIGWCTAEYVSSRMCGIGIATVEVYQRRGIATATAARFVQEALRRSVTPHWECRVNNLASARVAEKIGFTKIEEVGQWIGSFQ